MFQNPEIALDDLPGTGDVQWEPMHALYTRAIRVMTAIVLIIAAVVISVISFLASFPWFVVVALFTLLLIVGIHSMVWPGIAVPRRGYALRDKDILFRKGVIWRSVTAVPFNRIQHVETSSTPMDRRYGLATLQLFTAGGSSGDLKIDGLGKDIAEQLRVFILDKAGAVIEHA
jgi:membrane protein YdbS with pleckstrin-like domain